MPTLQNWNFMNNKKQLWLSTYNTVFPLSQPQGPD